MWGVAEIGVVVAAVPLVGGLISFIRNEHLKSRERRVDRLNEYRKSIQMDDKIASVMFLCERDILETNFFEGKVDAQLYMNVIATLGFFDAMCYSFYTKNLGIDEFLYFWGEMEEVMANRSIRKYLDFLEKRNYEFSKQALHDCKSLANCIMPYEFLQVFNRVNQSQLNVTTRNKMMKLFKTEVKKINGELIKRYKPLI